MADEVKPEVIKKTQEVLGKFIKKPNLTEKLLKKPPFRFLHDICTSVMKETGFFEQVLGPEDKIENIKDKEGKIEFLKKVIAAVEAASSIKLTVKPNKVVAGLEATKTNEFLQALGKVLEKQQSEKINSKTANLSKAKSTNKIGKETKDESSDKKTSNRVKKVEKNSTNESSDHKGKTDLQTPVSPKKKHSNKKPEPSLSRNDDKAEQENIKSKNINNSFTEEKEEERIQKNSAHGDVELKNLQDAKIVKVNGIDGQGDQNFKEEEEMVQSGEQRTGNSAKNKHRRLSIHTIPDQMKITETLENKKNLNKNADGSGDSVMNEKSNLLNKSEFQNQTTPIISSQMNYSKKGTSLVKEGTIISRPRTGIRATTARPASARPAAPRIRDRGDITVSEEIMKPASGKVQVIADEVTANDADDENLISLEIPNDLQETTPILSQGIAGSEQEHGHLVGQILEAQKELEDDSQFSEQKESKKTEIELFQEWEFGRSREPTNKEIEKLRANIQNLTRTVNPLGKLLDFFQEDIEIVQKELESWKEKNATYTLHIEQEKSITEQYVEPLKIHLKELQKSIDDQMEQINLVKANIIRNNEKIHKLLSGL